MKQIPYIASIFFYLMLYSCANIVPPTGGEKDVTPPQIVGFSPANLSTGFQGEKIIIEFDEIIQVSTGVDNILYSPPFETKPQITAIGKKMIIHFQEPLTPNTTYSINFGESIKDWNEGNPYRNLSYIFSTGEKLDSVSLQGKVVAAENNLGVADVQVMLYLKETDSILTEAKPFYVTQTDATGQFYFTHLKEGEFQIAALVDQNFNYLFDQKSESLAFQDNSIKLSSTHKLNDDLVLFKEEKPFTIDAIEVGKNHVAFAFPKAVDNVSFDTDIYNESDILFFSPQKDTLHYWFHAMSSQANFYLGVDEAPEDTIDMSFRSVDSLALRVKPSTSLKAGDPFLIHFSTPITASDVSRVAVFDTTGAEVPFTLELTDYTTAAIAAKWQAGQLYDIHISPAAFTDYVGNKNEEEEIAIGVSDASARSSLILSFITDKVGQNIQVDLLNGEGEYISSQALTQSKMTFKSLALGNYIIKIYNDLNGNQTWDTGNYAQKKQAETVLFYSAPQELKSNWDKEVEISF